MIYTFFWLFASIVNLEFRKTLYRSQLQRTVNTTSSFNSSDEATVWGPDPDAESVPQSRALTAV